MPPPPPPPRDAVSQHVCVSATCTFMVRSVRMPNYLCATILYDYRRSCGAFLLPNRFDAVITAPVVRGSSSSQTLLWGSDVAVIPADVALHGCNTTHHVCLVRSGFGSSCGRPAHCLHRLMGSGCVRGETERSMIGRQGLLVCCG